MLRKLTIGFRPKLILTVMFLSLFCAPYVLINSFSGFAIFDDEGTIMIMFRELLAGKTAYSDVYSLYGPFYLIIFTEFFRSSVMPLTHDSARLISAFFWIANSVCFGALTGRLTRSVGAASIAFVFVLFALREFPFSPIHPQELAFLLTGLVFHLILTRDGGCRLWMSFGVGIIISILLLIKINIGIFVGMAVMIAFVRALPQSTSVRILGRLGTLAAILLPAGVMLPLLDLPWVATYCVFATLAIGASCVAWTCQEPAFRSEPGLEWRDLYGAAIGGFFSALVGIVWFLPSGTKLEDIASAVLLQSSQWMRFWNIDPQLGYPALGSAIMSLMAACCWALLGRHGTQPVWARGLLHAAKLALALGWTAAIAYAALRADPMRIIAPHAVHLLSPWMWLILVSSGQADRFLTRGAVGWAATLFILYPFPVAGGQLALTAVLPLALLPVMASDAIRYGHEHAWWPRMVSELPAWSGTLVALGLAIGLVSAQTEHRLRVRNAMVSLDLPGARLIRVPDSEARQMHGIVALLEGCPHFYAVPGLPSLYFWLNRPAPSAMLSNNPVGILTRGQQLRLVEDLERYPDLCLLVSPQLNQILWNRGQFAAKLPLAVYMENFSEDHGSAGVFHIKRRPASR